MKYLIKFSYFILLFLSVSILLHASAKDDLANAEEAMQKGFLTQKAWEIFKSERDTDLLKKPYGDMPLRAVYSLSVMGLYPNPEEPYHLEEKITIPHAVKLAMYITGKAKEIEKGSFTHPYKNIPPEYEKYVGFAYKNGYLPDIMKTAINADEQIQFEEYETILLKILGYEEGTDFTADDVTKFAMAKGYPPKPYAGKPFLKADIIELNGLTLSRSLKGSHTNLRNTLISKNLISTKTDNFLSEQRYKVYTYDTRDNFSEVLWKYKRMYDFIYTLDCRNGPAPIHPGLSWPDKGVSLDYAGYIKIMTENLDENFARGVLDRMLDDLQLKPVQKEQLLTKLKSADSAQHIDYYTRIVEVSIKKRFINVELYLPYHKK